MNKCHFYLSNGLWEIVKCHILGQDTSNQKISMVYLWGVAVAPHQLCFASHIKSTPWQQSWASLNILRHSKNAESRIADEEINNVRHEIDVQYTLRHFSSTDFVQEFFGRIGKKIAEKNEIAAEVEINLDELLTYVLKQCPSSAHCLSRQVADFITLSAPSGTASVELLFLMIATANEPPSLDHLQPLTSSVYKKELFYLLLASGHGAIVSRLEMEQRKLAADAALAHLEQLVHSSIETSKFFQTVVLTNRHFVLYLIDMLEIYLELISPALPETQRVPSYLWPLLLLRLWGKPGVSETQIQNLIQQCKESTTDQALVRVCFMLDWYMSFSQWSASQGSDKRVGLEASRDHSVLHLIHASADLAECDWTQVRALLHDAWDIHLLDSFCVIMLLLRALLSASVMKYDRSRLCNAIEAEKKHAERYAAEITGTLERISTTVAKIAPIRFQLEVLENLFAVLFITYEDLKNTNIGPSIGVNDESTLSGFVASPNILRDTVCMLRNCLTRMEGELRDSSETLPCSIKPSQVENRMDRLSESLSEALWRIQLVMGADFVGQVGSGCCIVDHNIFQPEWLVVESGPEFSKSKRRSQPEGSLSPVIALMDRTPAPAFMNQMLASDAALVVRCLSQGDLLNVEHIITMMSSEENRQVLEGELNFTVGEKGIRRSLSHLEDSPARKNSLNKSPANASLQTVQQIAAQAVSSSALTGQVERFISGNTLPTIQGSSKITLGSMLQCIENSAATVIVDLAVTATTSYNDFCELMNLAGKHCPELAMARQQPFIHGLVSPKPLGYIAFAQTLMPLLQDLNKNTHVSPAAFLRTRHASFSHKILKDQEVMWKTLSGIIKEVASDKDSVREPGKSQKNIKSMQKVFENVSKHLENSAELLDLGRIEYGTSDLAKHVNYVDLLNRYLSDLATLSLDFVAVKPELDDGISFHSLLSQSAVQVLDKLIFERNVDPALLEKKAQQLGFNLGASLLWGCAPPVPHYFSTTQQDKKLENIILNDRVPGLNQQGTGGIEELVSSILSDLLRRLSEINVEKGFHCCEKYVKMTNISCSSEDPEVQAILQRCQYLQDVNIPDMTPSQLLMFYVNLTNLLCMHCLLHPAAAPGFLSDDRLAREATFWFVGYRIGNSEFISLAQLQTMICGEELGLMFASRRPKSAMKIEPDPRAVFLLPLIQGISPGVRITVASYNEASDAFASAIESYARRYIVTEGLAMIIPPLLDWYLDTVLMLEEAEGSSDGSTHTLRRRLDVLLEFLIDNCASSEWEACLKAWRSSDLSLRVGEVTEFPSLCLDYCWHEQPAQPLRTSALPSNDRPVNWETRSLSESILKQLSQSSQLLTDLVIRLHETREGNDGRIVEIGQDVLSEERLRRLDALLSAPWLPTLAPLFGNNVVLAALHITPDSTNMWGHLNNLVASKLWTECRAFLSVLPDFVVDRDINLRRVDDLVLCELAAMNSKSGGAGWSYAQQIQDMNLRMECIQTNQCLWPGDVAVKVLNSLISDQSLDAEVVAEINASIYKIKIFNEISHECEEFEGKSWFEVSLLSSANPSIVLRAIKRSNHKSLFFDWIVLPGVLESIEPFLDASLVILLASSFPKKLVDLSVRLRSSTILQLGDQALKQLESLSALRCVAQLCLKVCPDGVELQYQKLLLGIDLLSGLPSNDQNVLMPLVSEPMLVIEQLVMNTHLGTLEILLEKIRASDGIVLDDSKVADLLCHYASLAVHLDVVNVQPAVRQNYFVVPAGFEVPPDVPVESAWVPDNQVTVCMCCHLLTFSMFNRRHHCRRCGRVVCAGCSQNRIKIEGYLDVPVRVCQNCYSHHTKPESEASGSLYDSGTITNAGEQWRLTLDPKHNDAIRSEFCYEYSPNAALCLSIYNLIPVTPEYTGQLLDKSEKLLEMLQGGDAAGNPEVDIPMLIQIIRALVIGAKVRYNQAGLSTGVVSCDRLLSQVDVISLLVKNHCTHLIPPEPLVEKTMRALRDRLVEEELWELAIEFSTKAGFSHAGVWASWGKSLLAAGCWEEARIKLSQCLAPSAQNNRSSPLLEEICEVIESTTLTTIRDSEAAMEVHELLGSLKSIAAGKIPGKLPSGPGSPQYIEQEWYLSRFGSGACFKFYARKQQWVTAINYMLQRQLDQDLFNEFLLLVAYRTNCEDALKGAIMQTDPTLENLKRYLTGGCLYLQKIDCLHYLHNLQVFMQDYVRAAMTCIQLYQSFASSYSQLMEMADLLHSALRHLEQAMASSKPDKKTVNLDFVMYMEEKDITRHMNTIWRQLETTKYLAKCEQQSDLLKRYLESSRRKPTLFKGVCRSLVAGLCVMGGKNVEEGFGLSFRIIQDFNLDITEVMGGVASFFGGTGRGEDLAKMVNCIATSGIENHSTICDEVILKSISSMVSEDKLVIFDVVFPLITSIDAKIKASITAQKLKSAYLMAVKYNKLSLVETIMEEADRLGQTAIRDICRKKLGMISETQSMVSSLSSSME